MAKPPSQLPAPAQSESSQTTIAKEELLSITQLLHLIHHRNKNQHRLTKWWKPFSVLRRNISKLVSEVENLETAEKFSGKGKGEKYVRGAREVVERRVEFLEDWLIEKAYVAFSTVVKDLQYANLGLMLMGMLARIRTAIRPLGKEQVEEEQDGVEVLPKAKVAVSRDDDERQDFGEVVQRDEIISRDEELDGEAATTPKKPKIKRPKTEAAVTPTSNVEPRQKKGHKEEKKKKKRKIGDAFDDLFDSLI